jgi:glucosamine-6-phosphate deaminase
MKIQLADDYGEMSKQAAAHIAELIRNNNAQGKQTVLGLATGNTPIGIYAELVRLHQQEGLSFERVVTFNLDEYWPLEPTHKQSYHHFMHDHLFKHINIKTENIHIPDGTIAAEDMDAYCKDYEAAIKAAGGIDLQLLGIGAEGHLGFNESQKSDENYCLTSRTRMVTLSEQTIADNSPPAHQAITMGLGTIMEAKELMLVANGENKAKIIKETLQNKFNTSTPATLINFHKNSFVYLDAAAASQAKDMISTLQKSQQRCIA